MSRNDIHGIESGWSVKTADDKDIGAVKETTDRYILVKSGLINTAERYLPAVTLANVLPEMKEIRISLTEDEVENGDWSEPPAHGPRTEGAPLNPQYADGSDPVAKAPGDPDRPVV